MKLFRNQKPKGQSAASTPRSPPPSSLDSSSVRGSDLSARIEPYTFGNPSPPAQTQSRTSNHQQQQQQYALPGSTDSSTLAPARRHSMRARPSSEDPWVVVNDPSTNVESRSSSIASLMQPVLGATGATAPFISTQFIQQRERDREPPWANASNMSASHPPSPNPPPQLRTPQSNPSKQRPPPSSSTPQPSLEQQQQQQQQWQQPHTPQTQQPQPQPQPQPPLAGAQVPQQMNGLIPQPYPPEDINAYAMGNGGAYGNTNNAGREGSIHSQQDKGWTRGFFGASTGKEKEANAELMRMIGFLTAAAPDDWNLVLEVCERASANESAAKEASRALRREFKYGEPSAQLSAARLWAIMLQNATDTFILQTASRKFLENLEEVINAESTSPVVRERLLDVLASAAYVYGKKAGKEGFASTWRKVRPSWKPAEGVPFDPEDTLFESAFPRRAGGGLAPGVPVVGPGQGLAPGLVPPQVPVSQSPPVGNYGGGERRDDRSRRDRDRDRDRDKYHRQQQQYEATQYQPYRAGVAPPVPTRKDRGIIPPEEDMRRLLQECDVAKNNAQVLSQALPFATPATLGTDPLIQEFHTKCRASQELIVAQIPWASAGAERSRVAAAIRKSQKENSGSDGAANGKLTKKAPQNGSVDLTKEEKLLAALLTANQELVEVFRIYEELEKLAFDEMEEREVAKRSKVETKLDRTHIQYISPDGSMLMEPPASQGASSSRSPSPAIQTATVRTPSAASVPSAPSPVVKVPGARDLPHPPHPSNDHLSPNNPASLPPSPAVYQQQQHSHSQQQSISQIPPSPMQMTSPSQQQSMPSPQAPPTQPYHAHHASNHSLGGLNIPPSAPHGPRQPTGTGTRSRTPSPDRNGNFTPSHTPPTVAQNHVNMNAVPNPADYGPPTHPPPQLPRGAAAPAGARGVEAQRGRGESPANLAIGGGPPPGLAAVQNTAGIRIDMDAARRYSSQEEDLMTPVKPSAKAMGKRKAAVEAPPDDEELERREEAEMEEAFMRSTAPPGEGGETPVRTVQYVYDAAAERARELDRLEREEQELRRQQTRSSMQRIPGMGGGSGAGSVGAMNATKSLA